MDDIVHYHIIPNTPLEFVSVAKWTRLRALEYLPVTPFKCGCDDYWRTIKVLHATGHAAKIRDFTALNFSLEIAYKSFTKLARYQRMDILMRRYGYIKWFDRQTFDVIFETALRPLPWNIIAQICELLEWNIPEPTKLENLVNVMFFRTNDVMVDEKWNSGLAKNIIQFTLQHFPDIIAAYITSFVYRNNINPANGSDRCVLLVLSMDGINNLDLEPGEIYQASKKIWTRKLRQIGEELNGELYDEIKIKTPLFNRLRRRVGGYDNTLRIRHRHVMWELRRRFGRRVKLPE